MSTLKVDAIRHNSATSDAITTAADGTCTAKLTSVAGGGLSHRNKVINGGMMIHQRGDASATGSAAYLSCDRFKTNNGCGAQVAVTKSTDTPDGFSASTKWDCTTADASIGASDYFLIQHRLEGQNIQDFAKGTSSAKQFALSFYIKATKTGVYTVELEDVDNNRHCSKTITVSDTNWNRYKIIYPADTTGAFVNDNNFSLSINFWLLGGSNYTSGTLQSSSWGTGATTRCSSSNVNAMDSTSNNFFLTGVQLEVGDTVTTFEHRSHGEEFARCQRYYQQYVNISAVGYVPNNSSRTYSHGFFFPVEMRAAPTMSITNTGSSNGQYITDGATNRYVSSVLSQGSKTTHMSVSFNISGDLSDYRGAYLFGTENTTYQTTYKIEAEL